MGRKKHITLVKEFKEKLNSKIKIDKMILFGSRASGKSHRWSDFDLLIVSKDFKDKDTFNRSSGFWLIWNQDYPVDFLCYTNEEFNKLKNRVSIVREAVNTGVEV